MGIMKDPKVWTKFGPPPPGINLSDDARAEHVAILVMVCVAAFFIAVRLILRCILKDRLKADDWAIILALVGTAGSFRLLFTDI